MRRHEMDCTMEPSEVGEWVHYLDVADLERRYREAVELLRSIRTIGRMDDWTEYASRVFAFLAEEAKTDEST